MPGLIACNRRWDIGSDDLVFPGSGEIFLRLAWLVAIAVVFQIHKGSFNCENGALVQGFYIGMLVLLSTHIIVNVVLVYYSMQGAITDTAARRRIPKIIYFKLALFVPELAWLIMGTCWAFDDSGGCQWEIVATVKGAVLCGYFMFLVIIGTFAFIFDPLGSRHHPHSHGDDVAMATKKLWETRCRIICCCAACEEQSNDAFSDIAQLFTEFFKGLDLVPTDLAAGLILVQKEQKNQPTTMRLIPIPPSPKRAIRQSSSSVVVVNVEDPPSAPATPKHSSNHQEAASSPSGTALTHAETVQASEHTVVSVERDYPRAMPWMDLEFVTHYMRFAMGSYGWPLFMYNNIGTGCCKLWGNCRTASRVYMSCCCMCTSASDSVVDDNCCQCHLSAIVNTTGIQEEDVIYASFHNRIYEIPFYIALDHRYCCVVVAIRGTLSLRDALTDMTADSEQIQVDGVEEARAHRGILNAAQGIKRKLEKLQLLQTAFHRAQGYGLVITGHSLGAGAASLLSVLLRPHYPQLICYAYSPPGGLLSMSLSQYTEQFVCSVVLGKDVIPRLSLVTMDDLKSSLLRAIKDCHKPKYRILAGGCWQVACGSSSAEDDSNNALRRPLLDDRTTSSPQYTGSQADMEMTEHCASPRTFQQTLQDAIVSSNRSRITHEPLYPPGHILYIQETQQESRPCCGEPTYEAAWAQPDAFSEILVSPKMVADHMPLAVLRALEQLSNRHGNPAYIIQTEQHGPVT